MRYITEKNLVFINDRLASLDVYRQLANESQGDERIRDSILAKIQKAEDEIRASYFERVEPNGSTRVRHPTIAVIEVAHDILKEPRRLFGNKINSLVTYTLTVSNADAVIDADGVIRYEPYAEVGRFTLSEQAFNNLLASSGSQSMPMNIESLAGYQIDPAIPDAFEAEAKALMSQIDKELETRGSSLASVVERLKQHQEKGGKLSATAIGEMSGIASLPSTLKSNMAFHVGMIAEYAQEVTTAQRLEVEAVIRVHQQQEIL